MHLSYRQLYYVMVKYILNSPENNLLLDVFLTIQDHSFLIPSNKELFDVLVFRLMCEDNVILTYSEIDLSYKVLSLCLAYDWIDVTLIDLSKSLLSSFYILLYV